MKELKGAIYFTDDGIVAGYLMVGDVHFQISGVQVNKIRTEIEGRKTDNIENKKIRQTDLFDDRSGDSGERKRDLAGG